MGAALDYSFALLDAVYGIREQVGVTASSGVTPRPRVPVEFTIASVYDAALRTQPDFIGPITLSQMFGFCAKTSKMPQSFLALHSPFFARIVCGLGSEQVDEYYPSSER